MFRHLHIFLPVVLCLAAVGAAEPPGPAGGRFPAELTTLTGHRHTGSLEEILGDQATLKTRGGNVRVPLAEVLELRMIRPKTAVLVDSRRTELTLTDGSHLFWTSLGVNNQQVAVETAQLGKFTVPITAVGSIRLANLDPTVAESWKELAAREVTQDMLVIRKGNVLDHLDGTVGAIDETTIRFVFDGEERTIKRGGKIFGIVYARRNAEAGKPICELTTSGGDLLKAQSAGGTPDRF